MLPERVAPDPTTKLALTPKFNRVVVLVPPAWAAPDPPNKLALKPGFDWVVSCKLALKPEFCCLPLASGGANVTSGIAPPMLRPVAVKGVPPGDTAIILVFAVLVVVMAAIGVPPGDEGIALAFVVAAAAVARFVDIVASLGESWV